MVDGYPLTMLDEWTFAPGEFFDYRLMPPLSQALAEMARRLAKLVAPVVEQVAQRLTKGQGTAARSLIAPTLLTQANRSVERDRVRTSTRRDATPVKLDTPSACREWGLILENAVRHYCNDCLPESGRLSQRRSVMRGERSFRQCVLKALIRHRREKLLRSAARS